MELLELMELTAAPPPSTVVLVGQELDLLQ